jgi:hypothetical protein
MILRIMLIIAIVCLWPHVSWPDSVQERLRRARSLESDPSNLSAENRLNHTRVSASTENPQNSQQVISWPEDPSRTEPSIDASAAVVPKDAPTIISTTVETPNAAFDAVAPDVSAPSMEVSHSIDPSPNSAPVVVSTPDANPEFHLIADVYRTVYDAITNKDRDTLLANCAGNCLQVVSRAPAGYILAILKMQFPSVNMRPEKVSVDGDRATLVLRDPAKPNKTTEMLFLKEGGTWKFDQQGATFESGGGWAEEESTQIPTAAPVDSQPLQDLYAHVHQAMINGNYDEVMNDSTKDQRDMYEQSKNIPALKTFLDLGRNLLPKTYEFVDATIDEDKGTAQLNLHSTDAKFPTYAGKVLFQKEDGQWRVSKSNWFIAH